MNNMLTIDRDFNGTLIKQRKSDGYLDATAMCKATGKQFKHYLENQNTRDFLSALSRSVGIPTDLLVEKITTGPNEKRGSWAHPKVAIHLAQWCSPEFAVMVSDWVFELLMTGRVELAQPAPQLAPSMFMAGDPHIANQIMLANAAAEMLRMSADSKLKMLYQIGDYHNLATGFLPSYVEDQPTKCLTKLLKENSSRLSAKIVNVVLLELGILEEQERPSTKAENGVKVFKNLTDKGLEYGKNLVNPNNQRETQPHYYVERFPELLRMVNDHLMGNMPIMNGGAK